MNLTIIKNKNVILPILLFICLSVTSCFDVYYNVHILADGSITGSAKITTYRFRNKTDNKFANIFICSVWEDTDTKVKVFSNKNYCTATYKIHSFNKLIPRNNKVKGKNKSMFNVKTGYIRNDFTFDNYFDLDMSNDDPYATALFNEVRAYLTIKFPFNVSKTNGEKVNKNTVRWTLNTKNAKNHIYAKGSINNTQLTKKDLVGAYVIKVNYLLDEKNELSKNLRLEEEYAKTTDELTEQTDNELLILLNDFTKFYTKNIDPSNNISKKELIQYMKKEGISFKEYDLSNISFDNTKKTWSMNINI